MEKRGFTTQEVQAYLGVRRRFFETNIAPRLAGKGTPAGPSIIYERTDLDAVWDDYKASLSAARRVDVPATKPRVGGGSKLSFNEAKLAVVRAARTREK
ncbi:hypothetical protein CEY09_05325 [Achromobacter marplatensis]|uniref:Uncharacterized protein n=1 Tax=Achromobacter marplatensis TaxID=470868 RepID=A0ABX9GE28_9BURK|nr:hypothetical protein [Achromobacter marplatensis]OWT70992.1 hypothetical protein CEY09_05325 [Achromobacter marplatensis]RBP22610.1 hypothetical protein DFP87_102351 [Achromobacter marplatensis]CAB3648693.1 hypothetical protein LMG26219_02640 [Achromobacter marplatensis]